MIHETIDKSVGQGYYTLTSHMTKTKLDQQIKIAVTYLVIISGIWKDIKWNQREEV